MRSTGGILVAGGLTSSMVLAAMAWKRSLVAEALNKSQTASGMPSSLVQRILLQRQKTFHSGSVDCHVGSFPANEPSEDTYSVMYDAKRNLGAFGVFDGHGGTAASSYAERFLLKRVVGDFPNKKSATTAEYKKAMIDSFEYADHELLEHCLHFKEGFNNQDLFTGACLLSMVVTDEKLVVASAGDCRAVLCRRGVGPVELTKDHNATTNPAEVQRIRREHPEDPLAVYRGRVRGSLQPTRALGDFIYKHKFIHHSVMKQTGRAIFQEPFNPPYVTVRPDVAVLERQRDDRFVILATDGLWDCLSNREAVDIVESYERNEGNEDVENAATFLIRKALEKVGREILQKSGASSLQALQAVEQIPAKVRRSMHDDMTVSVVWLSDDHPVSHSSEAPRSRL